MTVPREWGLTPVTRTLEREHLPVGRLLGRARYSQIRVTLDVTRGAAHKHTLNTWRTIAASARLPGLSKRPVSVYLAEVCPDDVLRAIAKGAA